MEPDLLAVIRKVLDIVLTTNFGILFVPLFALMVSPFIGLVVIAGLAASIPIAKRCVTPGSWRREHGWSLLVPGVGLWMRRRLARENPAAAALSLRLAVVGGVAMLILSTALNASSFTRQDEKLRRAMQTDESAAAYMRGPAGRYPLERLHPSTLTQGLTPEEQQRFRRAWRNAERERWRKQIQSRAGSLPLGPAQSMLGYESLTPSQQAEFDAAWRELAHRRD